MKAQLFSLDSLVAFSIFFIVLGMIAYLWIEFSLIPSFEIQEKANEVADFLVSSKLGDENVLNCSKLFELTLEDYEVLRKELNIGPYDIWINIEGMDSAMCPNVRPNLDIMLVLDVSGSMGRQQNPQKIIALKNASVTFIEQLNQSYDMAGLISYSTNANVIYGLLNMTAANKTILEGAPCIVDACQSCGTGINRMCCSSFYSFCNPNRTRITYCDNCQGGTYMGAGIRNATYQESLGRPFPPNFKIQILLSDGNPTYPAGGGSRTTPGDIQDVISAAHDACVANNIIYTISLGSDANRTLMQQVASMTYGKEYYSPTPDDLRNIFLNLSREIAVTSNYGKIAPNSVKNMATITRIVIAGNKTMKMNIRLFEFVPGVTEVCT